MDLSIIIVNYNTMELTRNVLASIYKNTYTFDYEVFVVDNASTDNSIEMVKKEFAMTILIESKTNLGFSKANNIAIQSAKGRYILLLNSDTEVMENTFDSCIKYMDKCLDIGALGCKVVLPDGSLDKACKRSFPTPENALYNTLKLDKLFPKSRKFGAYNLSYLNEDHIHEIDCLVGAFMLVRRQVIAEIGALDEDFFMYGEDIDWCYRIKQAAWKIVYYPMVKIVHYKGGSSKKRNPKLIFEFYRAMYLFYKKHYRGKYPFFVTILTYIGIGSILGLKLVLNVFKNSRRIS